MGEKIKTSEAKDFSHEVLSTAVDFMYGIDIPEDFKDLNDLKSLLHLADLYLMEDLKDAVGSRIGDKLEQDNIMETVQLAEKFRAMELSDKCADFLLDKIDALGEEELANMSPGVVLSTMGRKALSELKRKGRWLEKLLGGKVEFKRLADFETEEIYKGYVMTQLLPKMLVRFNGGGDWDADMKEGEIGIVVRKDINSVKVNFLDRGQETVYYENLDILTLPVKFTF